LRYRWRRKRILEKTVEELKRQLQPKRTHTDDDVGAKKFKLGAHKYEEYKGVLFGSDL
jgi:hypothetical protein